MTGTIILVIILAVATIAVALSEFRTMIQMSKEEEHFLRLLAREIEEEISKKGKRSCS